MVAAIERFAAANAVELTRADAKAAVLLAFTGAVMGIAISGVAKGPQAAAGPGGVLWWSGTVCGLLAVGCFVRAIAPRHRTRGENGRHDGPGYFQHVTGEMTGERLRRAFEQVGRDPAPPLLASLERTSGIIRVKYRWIEAGTVLLLLALPQYALLVRPG
ncbi:Pycsar system effector family protein [Streptomyces lonarensis]|uniref:Pycsar effector protein domain-containing protein n=1 Tax=Streptomyces lonarensis TaxID=700599 RepID=A0A7X6HYV6_9ACTN|nr:Pycsar system effector family protein [Streptomyces lonarensis]NJQ05835.1 hypothetical protein [Streptomyces lonarensis]